MIFNLVCVNSISMAAVQNWHMVGMQTWKAVLTTMITLSQWKINTCASVTSEMVSELLFTQSN